MNEEEKKESELKDSDSNLYDDSLDDLIKPLLKQNPEMSDEDVEELKKVLDLLVKNNRKHVNKSGYFKKFIKSFIIYLISSFSMLGFFFSLISLENKLLVLFLPISLTFILTVYETIKYFQFVKKPLITSMKPYIIEITIICLLGFFTNEFIKLFNYSIILSLYIVCIIVFKILINSAINRLLRRKIIIERGNDDV